MALVQAELEFFAIECPEEAQTKLFQVVSDKVIEVMGGILRVINDYEVNYRVIKSNDTNTRTDGRGAVVSIKPEALAITGDAVAFDAADDS